MLLVDAAISTATVAAGARGGPRGAVAGEVRRIPGTPGLTPGGGSAAARLRSSTSPRGSSRSASSTPHPPSAHNSHRQQLISSSAGTGGSIHHQDSPRALGDKVTGWGRRPKSANARPQGDAPWRRDLEDSDAFDESQRILRSSLASSLSASTGPPSATAAPSLAQKFHDDFVAYDDDKDDDEEDDEDDDTTMTKSKMILSKAGVR